MLYMPTADFHATSLFDVNQTVTAVHQRRLSLMWLTTPHITLSVHRRGRKPQWWMDTTVSNSK